MRITDILPFTQAPVKTSQKQATILPQTDQKSLSKSFRTAALALGYQNFSTRATSNDTFETSPFDFDRIVQAIDTDSYARQAINKYKELFWKEGWEIVSENPAARAYILQRIDFLEVAMKRPFQEFLTEVADQLVRFGNVFIVKSRGDLQQVYPDKLYPPEDRKPIIGYYLIPTERVEIMRTKTNKVLWYRQRTDSTGLSNPNQNMPRWKAEDVIHITVDRKPGRIFGTPFIVSAMDDIVALRQIEEDIQNLVHRELFPLYKFKVGTPEHPAQDDELDNAAMEIESLRSEGAIVMSDRYDVDVIGAEGNAMDASKYLEHFKERVAIGLGVYPHHLGMTSNASQAMTDRLDSALYDKVKEYQRKFADAVRLYIFNELLIEGGYDPYVNPELASVSDRCMFRFNEIDADTEIKKGAYILSKVAAGVETIPEGRLELKMRPDMDESETATAQQVRLMPDQTVTDKTPTGGSTTKTVDTTPSAAKQAPSTGGKPNMKNTRKGSGNVIRPQNQYGTRTSPNIRRSDDDDLIREMVELLDDDIMLED